MPKGCGVDEMILTPWTKSQIDALTYEELLCKWRNAPLGDTWLQDETGKYWGERMAYMRTLTNDNGVSASKRIGWD